MHIIVSYDVVDDRIRTRLAKALIRYLDRVQKSVFEGKVNYDIYLKIKQSITEIADLEVDSIRIYHLCGRCIPLTEVYGVTTYIPCGEEDEII